MTISFADIELALRAEDVEGLLALGAPSDEYSSEAKEIASALMMLRGDQITEASAVAIISLVWAKSFNRSGWEIEERLPAFQRIAQRLL